MLRCFMTYSPLSIKRRNILGNIYNQCDSINSIPVYMETKDEEPIGSVDESLGRYADAFVFHLPEDVCKKLSTGSYELFFDFDTVSKTKRIKLNCIVLVSKQLPVAVPRRNARLLA
ncbi:MAG: hypothetical protein ACR2GD_11160 [Pyrinomonadaceae bacterium]